MKNDNDQSGNGSKYLNRPHFRVVVGFAMSVFIIISLLSVIVPLSDYSDANSTAEITVVANDNVMGSVTGSGTYAINSTQIITARGFTRRPLISRPARRSTVGLRRTPTG